MSKTIYRPDSHEACVTQALTLIQQADAFLIVTQKLQSGEWKLKTKKNGFEIHHKNGTVLAKAASRHEAEKLALANTQGE